MLGGVARRVVDAANDAHLRGAVPLAAHVAGAQVQPAEGQSRRAELSVEQVGSRVRDGGDAEVTVMEPDRHRRIACAVVLSKQAAGGGLRTVRRIKAQGGRGRRGVCDAVPVRDAHACPALVAADRVCPQLGVARVAASPGDATLVEAGDHAHPLHDGVAGVGSWQRQEDRQCVAGVLGERPARVHPPRALDMFLDLVSGPDRVQVRRQLGQPFRGRLACPAKDGVVVGGLCLCGLHPEYSDEVVRVVPVELTDPLQRGGHLGRTPRTPGAVQGGSGRAVARGHVPVKLRRGGGMVLQGQRTELVPPGQSPEDLVAHGEGLAREPRGLPDTGDRRPGADLGGQLVKQGIRQRDGRDLGHGSLLHRKCYTVRCKHYIDRCN